MEALLENPERELFFWCIFLNFQDMARIFWRAGIDYIGGALTASRILSSMSRVALDRLEEFELSRQLSEEARKFEEEAKSILNECYACSPEPAKDLMVRSLANWGDRTLFNVAYDAQLMNFSEHDCCQAKLNFIWFGRIRSHTNPWIVFAGLFLPFLVAPFIDFRDSDGGGNDDNSVAPLIDYADDNTGNNGNNNNNRNRLGSSDSKLGILARQRSGSVRDEGEGGSRRRRGCCRRYAVDLWSFFCSPIVKFSYFTISYLAFLCIFSYFVMIELAPNVVGVLEILVWIWMVTTAVEELRKVAIERAPTLKLKIARHFYDHWSYYDLVVKALAVTAVALRFAIGDVGSFGIVRIVYSVVLLLSILRLLKLSYVHQYIGPKVIMIQTVLQDLMFFVLIFGVFLFAYGVAAHSLMYPNSDPTFNLLVNIVYRPYFTLFGQFDLDELMGRVQGCTSNRTVHASDPWNNPLCSTYSWMTVVLFSMYAMLVCIMLINLLVAIFSFTFTSIQETALRTWQFHRIAVIREFAEKPNLPPPFILISHLFMLVRFLHSCAKERKEKRRQPIRDDFRMEYEEDKNSRLSALERMGMENHLINVKMQLKNDNNFLIASTSGRTEVIVGHLENIREFFAKKALKKSSNSGKNNNSNNIGSCDDDEKIQRLKAKEEQKRHEMLTERMSKLEAGLERQGRQLDVLLKLLREKSSSSSAPVKTS